MFQSLTVGEQAARTFKWFYLLIALGTCASCHADPGKFIRVTGSHNLVPTIQESVICRVSSELILDYNYKKVALNDSLSKVIFNRYLKSLDDGHLYFLADDVKSFVKYETALDNDIREGNLNDVFYMFNLFKKRYEERLRFALSQLDSVFDFTTNETFSFDRETETYASSTGEIDGYWTKRV